MSRADLGLLLKIARYQKYFSFVSFFYLPLVTVIIYLARNMIVDHSLADELFPRVYLFSTFVAVGLFFIPRLLQVTITRVPPPWLTASGEQFKMFTVRYTYVSQLRLLFRHSHHDPQSRGFQHELCLKEKCICTGCYGTVVGILLSLIMMLSHVVSMVSREVGQKTVGVTNDFPLNEALLMIVFSWLLFGLFLLKYHLPAFKNPKMRVFLNALVPASLTALVIDLDRWQQNAVSLVLAALLLLPLIPLRVLLTRLEEFSSP